MIRALFRYILPGLLPDSSPTDGQLVFQKTRDNLLIGNLVVSSEEINRDIPMYYRQVKKYVLEHGVGVALRRIVYIRIIQKILDA
jgi:hypothetical protein